ncbi:hypothetical protein V6N11_067552 [Hibiscus sabdariffa]|uniref:Uncharacterized protein n=1 Tax=Hibiscus sabdariffa TaxID=183260 RepID=A0ABR2SRY1_9ROSI
MEPSNSHPSRPWWFGDRKQIINHVIGWIKKSINPFINGVTGDECNPVSTKKKANPYSICFTDGVKFVDPNHSFEAVEQQVLGSTSFPSMFGFVEQALLISPNLSETVMKGSRLEAVSVYASLMKEFAVFDRWFSSIPWVLVINWGITVKERKEEACNQCSGEFRVKVDSIELQAYSEFHDREGG